MVRRLERRSARILAIILAFIMLGSIFAYVSGGGMREKRNIKINLKMLEAVNYVPENTILFYYNILEYNTLLKRLGKNDPLLEYFEKDLNRELEFASMYYLNKRIVEFTHPIEELLVVQYGDFNIYFINENISKVYFAKQFEQNVDGFSIKVSGGVAVVEDFHPLLIGYTPFVLEVVKRINSGKGNDYGTHLTKLNDTFLFFFLIFGNETRKYIKFSQDNESALDFFFQGFRYNESSQRYEKIWGIHFTKNYFFSNINETEKNFEYYYFENFEDGFSIAVMGDRDFEKVLNATPNILGILISE
ncbi:MAG: hypothetical protein QXU61_01635 [Archaeoglobaceae archaeon]